jgi:hypothetical protein
MKRLCIAVVVMTLLPVAADAVTGQVLWSFGNNKPDGRYAWSSPVEGSNNRRFYAVLHMGGIKSPAGAVRAANEY